jgi:hypothetical protein
VGQNLEQYKFQEKIRKSYLRHCGDVISVSKETGVDLKTVRKLAKKIQGGEDWKHNVIIARNIQNLMLEKYNMRFIRLKKMLDDLESQEKQVLSSCCNKPVKRVGSSDKFICIKCGDECRQQAVQVLKIIDMEVGILEKMAADDARIQDFMIKMGVTEHPEQPINVRNTQNIVVMGDGGALTPEMKQKIKDINMMGPMERERVIRGLEDEIMKLNSEISNDERQELSNQSKEEERPQKREEVEDAQFETGNGEQRDTTP